MFGDYLTVDRKAWKDRVKFKISFFLFVYNNYFLLLRNTLFAAEAEMHDYKKVN